MEGMKDFALKSRAIFAISFCFFVKMRRKLDFQLPSYRIVEKYRIIFLTRKIFFSNRENEICQLEPRLDSVFARFSHSAAENGAKKRLLVVNGRFRSKLSTY